jgi:hypothetical protein
VSAVFHYYPANLTIRCFQTPSKVAESTMKYGNSYVTADSTSIFDVNRKISTCYLKVSDTQYKVS